MDIIVIREGIKGEKGDSGTGGIPPYHHLQTSPSLVWVMMHNRGQRPGGIMSYDYDSDTYPTPIDGKTIEGIITHVNDNVTLQTFSEPSVGSADLVF